MTRLNFSLNRIMQPNLPLSDFIQLAADCSASGVEIRNDLVDPSLLGGENPENIRNQCLRSGIEIFTVNALQRFNDPELFEEKTKELAEMMDEAASVGCRRIVLCPVNDPDDNRSPAQQHIDLVAALNKYSRLFGQYGMIGLVEPLGFDICSVRFKKQVVDAISETGLSPFYQIVHDTFHHYLSGETDFYPEQTGLIHASGVYEGKRPDTITDDDRFLVDSRDIMDNKGQILQLHNGGFRGMMSFEPFSPGVQTLSSEDIQTGIKQSMAYIFS